MFLTLTVHESFRPWIMMQEQSGTSNTTVSATGGTRSMNVIESSVSTQNAERVPSNDVQGNNIANPWGGQHW
jgi:hypothetical protein